MRDSKRSQPGCPLDLGDPVFAGILQRVFVGTAAYAIGAMIRSGQPEGHVSFAVELLAQLSIDLRERELFALALDCDEVEGLAIHPVCKRRPYNAVSGGDQIDLRSRGLRFGLPG